MKVIPNRAKQRILNGELALGMGLSRRATRRSFPRETEGGVERTAQTAGGGVRC